MQYKEMAEVDLKLSLLSGGKIDLDNLSIVPYTIREINDYGYTKYTRNLQWISISIDDFINSVEDKERKMFLEEQRKSLKTFDFYIKLGGKELYESLIEALSMIFRTDDIRVLDKGVIALDFVKLGIFYQDEDGEWSINHERLEELTEDEIKIIHRDNFDDIVSIVKLQNYLEKTKNKEDELNPADEEVRKLQEHMKKMREKVENAKRQQQQDDGNDREVDFADIVSAVSSKSNSINRLNIWGLTLYQLYDEYARLELIDNYDFSIKAIMAGAEKINLKHWSSRL